VQALRRGRLTVEPLVEVGYSRVARVGGGIFDPAAVYRRDHIWTLALGLRLSAGTTMHRMGRYGAAEETDMEMSMPHGETMP
jgi:hypothetical protein